MSKNRPAYLKEWKKKRYEQGLCFRCGKSLDRLPSATCSQCRAKSVARAKVWYQEQKTKKRCPSCFQYHNGSHVYCDSCNILRSKKVTDASHQRKANGICHRRTCNNPVGPESTIFCHEHYPHILELHRKKHDQQVFDGNREIVLERDNHQCTLCYSVKRLEVHHKNEDRKNNGLDNLVTICHSCHVTLTRLLNTPNIKGLLSLVNVQGGS